MYAPTLLMAKESDIVLYYHKDRKFGKSNDCEYGRQKSVSIHIGCIRNGFCRWRAEITERGFVYSSKGTPSVEECEKRIVMEGTVGDMSTTLTGLTGYTNYSIRAYAINKKWDDLQHHRHS